MHCVYIVDFDFYCDAVSFFLDGAECVYDKSGNHDYANSVVAKPLRFGEFSKKHFERAPFGKYFINSAIIVLINNGRVHFELQLYCIWFFKTAISGEKALVCTVAVHY